MDLEIFEAAREVIKAAKASDAMNKAATEATGAFYDRRRDLSKLLHCLTDIEETFCLHLESGETLMCHYDNEDGFTHYISVKGITESDSSKVITPASSPKKRLYRPLYSREFIEVPEDFDPESADLDAMRAKFYGDEIFLGGVDSETDA